LEIYKNSGRSIVTRLVDLIPIPTFGDHANTYLRVAFRLMCDKTTAGSAPVTG